MSQDPPSEEDRRHTRSQGPPPAAPAIDAAASASPGGTNSSPAQSVTLMVPTHHDVTVSGSPETHRAAAASPQDEAASATPPRSRSRRAGGADTAPLGVLPFGTEAEEDDSSDSETQVLSRGAFEAPSDSLPVGGPPQVLSRGAFDPIPVGGPPTTPLLDKLIPIGEVMRSPAGSVLGGIAPSVSHTRAMSTSMPQASPPQASQLDHRPAMQPTPNAQFREPPILEERQPKFTVIPRVVTPVVTQLSPEHQGLCQIIIDCGVETVTKVGRAYGVNEDVLEYQKLYEETPHSLNPTELAQRNEFRNLLLSLGKDAIKDFARLGVIPEAFGSNQSASVIPPDLPTPRRELSYPSPPVMGTMHPTNGVDNAPESNDHSLLGGAAYRWKVQTGSPPPPTASATADRAEAAPPPAASETTDGAETSGTEEPTRRERAIMFGYRPAAPGFGRKSIYRGSGGRPDVDVTAFTQAGSYDYDESSTGRDQHAKLPKLSFQFNQTTLDGLTSFPPDINPLRKAHVLSQKLQRAIQSTAEGGEVFASIAAATALANQDSLGNIRFIAPHLGQGVNADGMLVQKIDTVPLSPATQFTQDGIARQQYSLNNSLTQHSAIHGANDTTMIHAYNLYCSHAGYQVVPIASAARFYGWLVRHNTILASVLVSIISKDKDLLSQFEWTFVYPNRGSPWCGIQIAAAILIAGNMFERIGATPHELQNIRVGINRLHDSIPKHIEGLSESNLHVTSSHLLRIIQRARTLLGQLECFMTPEAYCDFLDRCCDQVRSHLLGSMDLMTNSLCQKVKIYFTNLRTTIIRAGIDYFNLMTSLNNLAIGIGPSLNALSRPPNAGTALLALPLPSKRDLAFQAQTQKVQALSEQLHHLRNKVKAGAGGGPPPTKQSGTRGDKRSNERYKSGDNNNDSKRRIPRDGCHLCKGPHMVLECPDFAAIVNPGRIARGEVPWEQRNRKEDKSRATLALLAHVFQQGLSDGDESPEGEGSESDISEGHVDAKDKTDVKTDHAYVGREDSASSADEDEINTYTRTPFPKVENIAHKHSSYFSSAETQHAKEEFHALYSCGPSSLPAAHPDFRSSVVHVASTWSEPFSTVTGIAVMQPRSPIEWKPKHEVSTAPQDGQVNGSPRERTPDSSPNHSPEDAGEHHDEHPGAGENDDDAEESNGEEDEHDDDEEESNDDDDKGDDDDDDEDDDDSPQGETSTSSSGEDNEDSADEASVMIIEPPTPEVITINDSSHDADDEISRNMSRMSMMSISPAVPSAAAAGPAGSPPARRAPYHHLNAPDPRSDVPYDPFLAVHAKYVEDVISLDKYHDRATADIYKVTEHIVLGIFNMAVRRMTAMNDLGSIVLILQVGNWFQEAHQVVYERMLIEGFEGQDFDITDRNFRNLQVALYRDYVVPAYRTLFPRIGTTDDMGFQAEFSYFNPEVDPNGVALLLIQGYLCKAYEVQNSVAPISELSRLLYEVLSYDSEIRHLLVRGTFDLSRVVFPNVEYVGMDTLSAADYSPSAPAYTRIHFDPGSTRIPFIVQPESLVVRRPSSPPLPAYFSPENANFYPFSPIRDDLSPSSPAYEAGARFIDDDEARSVRDTAIRVNLFAFDLPSAGAALGTAGADPQSAGAALGRSGTAGAALGTAGADPQSAGAALGSTSAHLRSAGAQLVAAGAELQPAGAMPGAAGAAPGTPDPDDLMFWQALDDHETFLREVPDETTSGAAGALPDSEDDVDTSQEPTGLRGGGSTNTRGPRTGCSVIRPRDPHQDSPDGSGFYGFSTANHPTEIIIDSGCSRSMLTDKRRFHSMYPVYPPIVIQGISGELRIHKMGDAVVDAYDTSGLPFRIYLRGAYLHPNGSVNLVSVRDLNESGYNVRFDVSVAHMIHTSSGTVLPLLSVGRLFGLNSRLHNDESISNDHAYFQLPVCRDNDQCFLTRGDLLHLRFHAGIGRLIKMCKAAPDLSNLRPDDLPNSRCRVCDEANAIRQAVPRTALRAYDSDADGWSVDQYDNGADCLTTEGNRYVYVFVMFYSRFIITELAPDRSESEVLRCFKSAITKAGKAPTLLRSDHGGEFESPAFNEFCATGLPLPIRREFSNAREQNQNGIAESAVDKLGKHSRVLLLQSNVPRELWGHATCHATDVVNHLPHRHIDNEIPIIKHGNPSYYTWFRPFGCLATAFRGKDEVDHRKLAPRGATGIYIGIGITDGQKGFRLYLPDTHEIVITQHATFDDTFFPLRTTDQRYNPDFTSRFVDIQSHPPAPSFSEDDLLSGPLQPLPLPSAGDSAPVVNDDISIKAVASTYAPTTAPKKDAPQQSPRAPWLSVAHKPLDDVSDKELVEFMIGEGPIFPVSGNYWKGSEGRRYECQVFDQQTRKSRGKKELFADTSIRCLEDDAEDMTMFWMPVTSTFRGALNLRGALKEACPTMKTLWDIVKIKPDAPKMTRLVKVKSKTAAAKTFLAESRLEGSPQDDIRLKREMISVSDSNFAYTVMTSLHAYVASFSKDGTAPDVLPAEPAGIDVLPPEPRTHRESFKRPDRHLWEEAERKELITLLDGGTFELVDYHHDMGRLLPVKWVYKLKKDEFGNFVKRKARLVVRGDMQDESTYESTFSPTSRAAAMRLLIAIATRENMELKHFDIQAAFISADVDKGNLTLAAPPGYGDLIGRTQCLLLKRSLYGLKQASHLYWRRLQKWMLDFGFLQIDDEGTLFLLVRGTNVMIVSMYVDDGLVAVNNIDFYEAFLQSFRDAFTISDQGDLHHYLGLKITRDRVAGTCELSQEQYVVDLLARFHCDKDNFKSSNTPYTPHTHLTKEDCCDRTDPANAGIIKEYQTVVGALLYLSGMSRPDIAFAVNQAARFMCNPGPPHIAHTKKILRYLSGTRDLKIRYAADVECPNTLMGYVDADHAGNPGDRISISGYIFFCNGGPISWASKRQPIIALSSSEAEFYAASLAACEIEYLRRLFDRMGFPQVGPTPIFEDNMGTIYMSRSVGAFNRTKHIDTRLFRLRELVEAGVIELVKIPTADNLADSFTKTVEVNIFQSHLAKYLV